MANTFTDNIAIIAENEVQLQRILSRMDRIMEEEFNIINILKQKELNLYMSKVKEWNTARSERV